MISFRDSEYGIDIIKEKIMIGQIFKDTVGLIRINIFNYSLPIFEIEEILNEARKMK